MNMCQLLDIFIEVTKYVFDYFNVIFKISVDSLGAQSVRFAPRRRGQSSAC